MVIVKEFGILKRIMPSFRLLKRVYGDQYVSPVPQWIPEDNILRAPARSWPEAKREKLKYYNISPKLFTRHLKGSTHITLYELQAIADILDCELEIVLSPKQPK